MVDLNQIFFNIVGSQFQILLLNIFLLLLSDGFLCSIFEEGVFLRCLWDLGLVNCDSDSLVNLVFANIIARIEDDVRIFDIVDKFCAFSL